MKLSKLPVLFLVAVFAFALNAAAPKYVFLFIGDGMAANQRLMSDKFSKAAGYGPLAMDQLEFKGMTTTKPANALVTDSAAAATALACGVKTKNGSLGVDPKGKSVESCAELAKKAGKKVGIVSSVTMTHATPAGFYSHSKSRGATYDIGAQLVDSGFDFFAGGGLDRRYDNKKERHYPKYGHLYKYAESKGYKVVKNKKEFLALRPSSKKVLTRFTDLVFPYAIDIDNKDKQTYPTLAEIVKKGIELLDGPEGFFMMVEGGRIDWSAHANDAATTMREIVALDESVKVALEFMRKHPKDTLVIVTGDHETGGLTVGVAGIAGKCDISVLSKQTMSVGEFDEAMRWAIKSNKNFGLEDAEKLITKAFGLKFKGDPAKDIMVLDDKDIANVRGAFARDFGNLISDAIKKKDVTDYLTKSKHRLGALLCKILSKKAGLAWAHGGHSATPVILTARGRNAELFAKPMENAEVGKILKSFYAK